VQNWINLSALWRTAVVGLLAGAGLPALFALGVRALASAQPRSEISPVHDGAARGSHAAFVAAGLCFGLVVAAIGYGIYLIISST
jgi:hypothetical protein